MFVSKNLKYLLGKKPSEILRIFEKDGNLKITKKAIKAVFERERFSLMSKHEATMINPAVKDVAYK